MSKSKIEWTESTWNPTTGCDKVSTGCKFCYAETMAKRLEAMGNKRYLDGFKLTLHHDKVDEPRKIKKGKLIFVNSMSDLFHKDVTLEFIQKVFKTMNETPQHTYQVLTKRSERLAEISDELRWSDNIWMGVSIENEDYLYRMEDLKQCGAKTKFISAEPLLGPLPNMNLSGIDWVIVGGESGPKSRPIEKEWVEDIQKQCNEQHVAFFFKQWGGKNKKMAGRLLNGKTYDEMPNIINQSA
jgi:protein gp37